MNKQVLDNALCNVSSEYIDEAVACTAFRARKNAKVQLLTAASVAAVTLIIITAAFVALRLSDDVTSPSPVISGTENNASGNTDTSKPVHTVVIPEGYVAVALSFTSNGDGTSTVCGLESYYTAEEPLTVSDEMIAQTIAYEPAEYLFPQNKYVIIRVGDDITVGYDVTSEVRFTESVVIPDGVTEIPDMAFADFTGLKSVVIPSTVTKIGSYAFTRCTSLEEITLPDGITEIGEFAFSECTSLKSINIPTSLTTISRSMLAECRSIVNLDLPKGLLSIDETAFVRTGLQILVIPDSVITLGDGVLAGCADMISLTLPFVGESRGNPLTLNYLFSTSTYAEQPKLKSLILTDSETIGDGAFNTESAIYITALALNEGITEIGAGVFPGVDAALERVTLPDSVIKTASLCGGSVKSLHIGAGLCDIVLENNEFPSLNELTVSELNQNFCAVGCVLFTKDMKTLVKYFGGGIDEYTVPEGVTALADYAFARCDVPKKIILPEGLSAIGAGAFAQCCALSSVNIPLSVRDIGSCAFAGGYNSLDILCYGSAPASGWAVDWCDPSSAGITVRWINTV